MGNNEKVLITKKVDPQKQQCYIVKAQLPTDRGDQAWEYGVQVVLGCTRDGTEFIGFGIRKTTGFRAGKRRADNTPPPPPPPSCPENPREQKSLNIYSNKKNTEEIQRASTVSGINFTRMSRKRRIRATDLDSLTRTWRFSLLKKQKTLKFHHGGRQMLQSLYPTKTDLLLAYVESICYAESRSKTISEKISPTKPLLTPKTTDPFLPSSSSFPCQTIEAVPPIEPNCDGPDA